MRTDHLNVVKLKTIVKRSKLTVAQIALDSLTSERTVTALLEGTQAEISSLTLGRILEALGSDQRAVTITL
jgi:hypothetical protein